MMRMGDTLVLVTSSSFHGNWAICMTWTQECIVPSTCLFRGLPCLVNSLSVFLTFAKLFCKVSNPSRWPWFGHSKVRQLPVHRSSCRIYIICNSWFLSWLKLYHNSLFTNHFLSGWCLSLHHEQSPLCVFKTITRTHFVIVSSTLLHHNPNVEGLWRIHRSMID